MADLLHTKAMYLCFVRVDPNDVAALVYIVEAHSEHQAKLVLADKGLYIAVYRLPETAQEPFEVCALDMLGVIG